MLLSTVAAVAATVGVSFAVTNGFAAPACKLAGSWSQSTSDVGSSTWVISASGQAREQGLGAATGRATLSGGVLAITWTTSNGWAGVYRWNLDADCSGSGTLRFTAGPRAGQTLSSTVTGPAPPDTPNNNNDPDFTVKYVVKISRASAGVFLVGDGELEGDAIRSLHPANRPINEYETMRPQTVDNLILIGYRTKTIVAVRSASYTRTKFGFTQNHLTLRVVVIRSASAACPVGTRGTISFTSPHTDHPLVEVCGFNAYRANRVGLHTDTKITLNSD